MEEVIKGAVSKFGKEAQKIVIIEECSELAKEICKYLRGKGDKSHLEEEIADVEIMAMQAEIIYGVKTVKLENHCCSMKEVLSELAVFSLRVSANMKVTGECIGDLLNSIEWLKNRLVLTCGVIEQKAYKIGRLSNLINQS